MENDILRLQNEGKTVILLAEAERILGIIAVADVLRENSRNTVSTLRKAGIEKLLC